MLYETIGSGLVLRITLQSFKAPDRLGLHPQSYGLTLVLSIFSAGSGRLAWPLRFAKSLPTVTCLRAHTMTRESEPPDESGDAILRRKFVRVINERDDGLVTFEFSIGWPELAVELMLPGQAFAEFCAREQVQRLDT